ncbi:MAG: Crp/Fnr family transcriptional regulator [Acidimicrobiia bacterium]|nr:Crp/Fnr family transcriptional regulator [Acidimicrobiia bacterium]
MPGELLGEYGVFEGRPRSTTAVTVGRATLVVIGAERFLELFETTPDLARGTARWLSLRTRGLADRFLEAAHASASVRVCARLLQLMSVSSYAEHEPVIVVMPISQADLAEWAGMSREAAVKALRELRDDGVVETSRGRILVLRPDMLRKRAEAILS